jgi:cyclopropane-fatty-acyl-phospholipid synthase
MNAILNFAKLNFTSTGLSNSNENMYRSMVISMLKKIQGGRLAIFEDGNSVQTFGAITSPDDINASITVNSAEMWSMTVTRGSIGAGEAYMAGHWTSPDLTQVIRLLVRNRDIVNGMDGQQSLFARMALKAIHVMNRNTKEGSKKNISAHYDLDNNFFKLFLDPAMMYSSAVFSHPAQSLADASINKLDVICKQLRLQPDDHLIEIGSGWGGMAIHAAKNYGCRVTTTTISQQQFDYAKAQIESEGLSDRITLLLQDYRELTGHYDKLVSIEMIEAVGAEFQQIYFETCNRLLKPGGRALIQAITISDGIYEQYLGDTDFIRQYIFPGGCLPTIQRMKKITQKHTDLELVEVSDITLDYALTLNHWRQRFLFNITQVMALGFDMSFIRMWEFYLCYCEGGFLEAGKPIDGTTNDGIGTHQLLFCKGST